MARVRSRSPAATAATRSRTTARKARAVTRIDHDIGCLNVERLPAELISVSGYHCNVWQAAGSFLRGGKRRSVVRIVKVHNEPVTFPEIRAQYRNYCELKDNLGSIVPDAAFVSTRIDGQPNMIVVAEVVKPWFNVANPTNESEAIPLLRKLPIATAQLRTFAEVAREWYDTREMRIVDLWGIDNLVLDRDLRIRYVDSFRVFFYADTLYVVEDPDDDLRKRVEMSLKRLEYLEHLVHELSYCLI